MEQAVRVAPQKIGATEPSGLAAQSEGPYWSEIDPPATPRRQTYAAAALRLSAPTTLLALSRATDAQPSWPMSCGSGAARSASPSR
jgi:hypothetical protein